MSEGAYDRVDHRELGPVAALLARFLLHELDASTLAELMPLQRELQDLGITLPAAAELDATAHQYFLAFVAPAASKPPVQSLWTEGRFDGESTLQVRALAAAVGFEPGPGARGAPEDHLGCILLLWLAAVEDGQVDVAQRLLADHLSWSLPMCQHLAAQGGFYGQVAVAVGGLVQELLPKHWQPPTAATRSQPGVSEP